MTGSEIAQIITAISALLAAGGSTLALVQGARNGRGIQDVKKATDGLTSALVEAKSQAATAEGTAAGIVEGHAAGLEQGRKEERK